MKQLATLRRDLSREAVKSCLRPLLSWGSESPSEPGFSIVLGVPWDLRDLLAVNLRFVARTDRRELKRIYIVFDRRRRPEMADAISQTRKRFPDLPLEFHCYPFLSGSIVERVHVSTFYNSMNTVIALGRCATRYAVLHDFDLYPMREDHFTDIVRAMRERALRFSGHELTHYDGLTGEDLQIGTWALGIDVQWLRANWRPVDAFHKMAPVRGRMTNLDPYAFIQSRTPERGLAGGLAPNDYCHVRNLCSTYLRFKAGRKVDVAWRLHYLWYLQDLSGNTGRIAVATRAMRGAASALLEVEGRSVDFSQVHVTCANVLRDELTRMDRFLVGAPRAEVLAFVDAFEDFLWRHGRRDELIDADGSVRWRPARGESAIGAAFRSAA